MTTIVSAPGKVLLAGGYLVLDPTYSGLVVATSSRFYCIIRPSPFSSSRLSTNSSSGGISVRAGQFPEDVSTWRYSVSATEHGLEVTGEGEGKNKFVEITVRNALTVVVESLAASGGAMAEAAKNVVNKIQADGGGLEIVVLADNDFYSQRESVRDLPRVNRQSVNLQLTAMSLPPLISSLDALPSFNPLPRAIHLTNKTGLGSSAALVTSLTAALLSHFGIVSIPTSPSPTFTSSPCTSTSTSPAGQTLSGDFDLIHNLAQFSHCLAQGKVGSGFDISSAVYGSHLYRRFSPKVLAPLMEQSSSSSSVPLLPALDRSKWDHQTTPFALPKGLRLMLADVDAGTDTPSFVGKVLKWREANKVEADELWGSLGRANDGLGELLRELAAKSGEEGYEGVLREAAGKAIDSVSLRDVFPQRNACAMQCG